MRLLFCKSFSSEYVTIIGQVEVLNILFNPRVFTSRIRFLFFPFVLKYAQAILC
ncbi:MAG: hypothetical protein LBJ00_10690 [Planctomycetaceae bacterium]|nr:hypothetical protein [Planctomycetaceae bacterium]